MFFFVTSFCLSYFALAVPARVRASSSRRARRVACWPSILSFFDERWVARVKFSATVCCCWCKSLATSSLSSWRATAASSASFLENIKICRSRATVDALENVRLRVLQRCKCHAHSCTVYYDILFPQVGFKHMSTLVADTYAVRSTYRLVLGNLTHLLRLPEDAGIPLRGHFAAFASSKSLSLIRLRSPSLPGIRCRPLQIAVVQNSKRFTIVFYFNVHAQSVHYMSHAHAQRGKCKDRFLCAGQVI